MWTHPPDSPCGGAAIGPPLRFASLPVPQGRVILYGRVRVSSSGIRADFDRYCATCDRSLPPESFAHDVSKGSGLKSICRECDRTKTRAYYDRERQKGEP